MLPNYNENMKIVIVYHGGCLDGIACSWVLQKYFTTTKNKNKDDIIMIGMSPQCLNLFEELDKHYINIESGFTLENNMKTGYNIIFVDICPTANILNDMIKLNNNNLSRFEVYDHHITNKDIFNINYNNFIANINWVFDMKRCGCQIVWDEFMITPVLGIIKARPKFIDYIGDGDLWKWELQDSKLTYGVLQNNFKSIDKLEKLYNLGDDYFTNTGESGFITQYLNKEKYIQEYCQKKINKLILKAEKRIIKVCYNEHKNINYNIWLVECFDISLCSELGSQLCKKVFNNENNDDENENNIYPDFVMIIKKINYDINYNFEHKLQFEISLRSNKYIKSEINVANISNIYGGGGHAQAAGFTISYEELCKIIIP